LEPQPKSDFWWQHFKRFYIESTDEISRRLTVKAKHFTSYQRGHAHAVPLKYCGPRPEKRNVSATRA